MTEQQVFELKYRVAYSFQLEKLNAILHRRMDKIILFIQFVLGSAVVTERGPAFLFGILVAVLAGLQFVIKPGEIAGAGKLQAQKYSELLDDIDSGNVDVNTVMQKIKVIEKSDSPVVMSLREPARNAASLMIGAEKDGKPTMLGRVFAWVCGENNI